MLRAKVPVGNMRVTSSHTVHLPHQSVSINPWSFFVSRVTIFGCCTTIMVMWNNRFFPFWFLFTKLFHWLKLIMRLVTSSNGQNLLTIVFPYFSHWIAVPLVFSSFPIPFLWLPRAWWHAGTAHRQGPSEARGNKGMWLKLGWTVGNVGQDWTW